MKAAIIVGLAVGAFLVGGCGSKSVAQNGPASPEKTPAETAPAGQSMDASPAPAEATHASPSPVTQPILTAWQEGDKGRAIKLFIEADWSARPTFASGMALSLSEDQFRALPEADRELKAKQMPAQLELLKQIITEVAQAGREAASQGDTALAQKCFTSLKQFGTALESPDRLRLVQLVGQTSKNMGNNELAKLAK